MWPLLAFAGIFATFAFIGASSASPLPASPKAAELRAALRKLWEDHITYIRNLIISAIGNLPDQQVVLQRLLRNQDNLGAAIKPYYGPATGDQLAKLLRDHILIAVDVVRAATSGDQGAVAVQQQRWSQTLETSQRSCRRRTRTCRRLRLNRCSRSTSISPPRRQYRGSTATGRATSPRTTKVTTTC